MRRITLCLSLLGAIALVPAAYAQDLAHSNGGNEPGTGRMVAMSINSNSETSIAASPSEVDHGTPVTVTADVQPTQGGPMPTGTVSFFVGGMQIGTATLHNTTASVTISTKDVPTGTFGIYAKYNGDKNYHWSQSDCVYVTVLCDSNTTSDMAASPSWIYPGTVVTLATDVSQNQGGPNPTGTVIFFEGPDCQHYLGSAPIINGVATLQVNTMSATHGAYSFTSYYLGNGTYLPSTSETDWVWVQ